MKVTEEDFASETLLRVRLKELKAEGYEVEDDHGGATFRTVIVRKGDHRIFLHWKR